MSSHSINLKMREYIKCPNCKRAINFPASDTLASAPESCPKCGFPLVGDVEPVPPRENARKRRTRLSFRIIVILFVVAFGITEAFYFLYKGYSDEYFGFTTNVSDTVAPLTIDDATWLSINGDELFRTRTLLTLALIKERAPSYYDLVSQNIKSVQELKSDRSLEIDGHKLHLQGIGAMVDSLSGKMWIKTRMAFGNDILRTWDWSVFNYAATLVHEATHVELKKQNIELETVEEEVACEKAALDFLIRAGGSKVLIDSKQTYIERPESKQYQRWYNWYHQFTSGS